ncbi:uracil-DNA glycosylase [Kordiimonas laminariae]|uniref:uracil-DNA glycosylase n=1 Tax=Kordiimonas laminariae TaxID=2917717 RepID=UPI001FF500E2|nr:uracil-DNA glycosylase [Kordiimonas laminariae]MCK0069596.1 uracil-DNA glycosylase [Kordiimonas laminariae]
MPELIEPEKHCNTCPRLTTFRQENRELYPDYHNGAVNNIGPMDAEIMILGLAPGLQGANKSGKPFIGDQSGDLLYATLSKLGYTNGEFHNGNAFTLNRALVTNAVRCVPPQNKPTAAEINNCRPYLLSLIDNMPKLKVIFALGKVAHDTALRTFGLQVSAHKFMHGCEYNLREGLWLVSSYHCSRYNLNTKVLTEEMFLSALNQAQKLSTQ